MKSNKIRLHGFEGFKCDRCGESFDVRGKLGRHVKEIHKGVEFEKEWKCEGEEGCGKHFTNKRMWRRHGKGEREWVCELCGKRYYDKIGLKVHFEVVHEGKREWSVARGLGMGMCEKTFVDTYGGEAVGVWDL